MNKSIAGKSVSTIGLGCVTFGREIDEAASFALMDHAVVRGVTLFDTAAAYGAGASERIVGRWWALRRPAGIVLATKLLPPYDPAILPRMLEQSLDRLGVGTVDVLYLHQWHASVEHPETLAALHQFVRSGRVRALGASNFNASQLAAALRGQAEAGLARFSVVQNNHNFAVSELTSDFLEVCSANRLAIVTYSPLGAGFLTGKHVRGVEAGTRFALVPGHKDIYFQDRAWQGLAGLQAVATRSGHTSAELALAWALHTPHVTSVLTGGRTTAQLDRAFAAQGLKDCLKDPALEAELQSQ